MGISPPADPPTVALNKVKKQMVAFQKEITGGTPVVVSADDFQAAIADYNSIKTESSMTIMIEDFQVWGPNGLVDAADLPIQVTDTKFKMSRQDVGTLTQRPRTGFRYAPNLRPPIGTTSNIYTISGPDGVYDVRARVLWFASGN